MSCLNRFHRVIAALVPVHVVDRSAGPRPQPATNRRPSRYDQLAASAPRRPATVVAAVSLSLFALGCDNLAPPMAKEDAVAGHKVSITASQETAPTPAVTVPKAANAALQMLLGSGDRPSAYAVPDNCWVLTEEDYPEDLDRDGLFDSCEYTAADSLSPTLHYASSDLSSLPVARHSFWAVAPSYSGVKAFYALGYFEDLGYMKAGTGPYSDHHGDSEFITVELVMTQEGELSHVRTCMSAHTGAGDEIECRNHDEYPREAWVAERKHANFFSRSDCDAGAFWLDSCDNVDSEVDLVVHSDRNMGSVIDPLVDCVRIPDSGRTDEECLWTDPKFDGWLPGYDDDAALGYGAFTADHFQHYYYSEPPTADFTVECEGSDCSFDASASTDDFTIEQYEWDVIVRRWGATPLDIYDRVVRTDTVPTWSHDFNVTEQVTLWIHFVARDHFSNPSEPLIVTMTLNCVNDCEAW